MRPQTDTRVLLVDLQPEEREAKGEELALAVVERDGYERDFEDWLEDMKASKKSRTKELERLDGNVSELARVLESGREERDVACSWLYSLGHGYAFLIRDDTGEMIAHRRLPDEERQADLTEVLREPTLEQLAEWLPKLAVNEAAEEHDDEGSGWDESDFANDPGALADAEAPGA
jgi:hypothetical protein